MFVVVLSLLLCVFIFLWIRRPKRPPGFPPGPPTRLIFGNLLTLIRSSGQNFPKILEELRQSCKCGIIGLLDPFGGHVVHVFDAEIIQQISSRHDCSGRPILFPILYRNYMKKQGIMFSEGAQWQEHRRFCLSHLRNLGFGKNSMNDAILVEFEQISAKMRKLAGSPVLVHSSYFNMASLNVIWKLIADKRFDDDDPEIRNLISLANNLSRYIGPQNPMNFFPWVRFIAPNWSGFNSLKQLRDANEEMFTNLLEEHRQTRIPHSPRDFIDVYIGEMETPRATERGFTEENICVIATDFFFAGSETTATTLQWAILLAALNKETQARVQQELDTCLGTDSLPRYDMRSQLPYTEAFVLEVLRFGGVVSQTVPHSNSFGAVQIAGYTFPKDTIFMMHLDTLKKSADLWGDPENFRPERFLNESGVVSAPDHFIPFGTGRRSCLGESLARMEIFLFFACLMQRFYFRLPDGFTPQLKPRYGVFLRPGDFSVIITERQR